MTIERRVQSDIQHIASSYFATENKAYHPKMMWGSINPSGNGECPIIFKPFMDPKAMGGRAPKSLEELLFMEDGTPFKPQPDYPSPVDGRPIPARLYYGEQCNFPDLSIPPPFPFRMRDLERIEQQGKVLAHLARLSALAEAARSLLNSLKEADIVSGEEAVCKHARDLERELTGLNF